MARRPTQSQTLLFRRLIDQLEPSLRKAFEEAVAALRQEVDWKSLLDALARNDVDGAVRALKIDRGVFNAYAMAKTQAFIEGGQLAVKTINPPSGPRGPFGSVSIRFDMSNPVAESWISRNVGQRITAMASDQLALVRATILEGYAQGHHPEVIAKSLAGKVIDGKRQGGVIGLTGPQAELVQAMRARLMSGDAEELKKVLDGMSLRDRRFDAMILKAIESGKAIKSTDIDRMVARYANRMLAKRAKDIARTETGMAVMAGRAEEWRQVCENLGYPMTAVIKKWTHGGGVKDPRPHHVAANGTVVHGLDTDFVMSNGARLKYALDPDAGAAEVVNCSCGTNFRLNHAWGLK